MKRKELLKLVIGLGLVAVLAVSIPIMSGCTGPTSTPEPTPTPEPTATPEPESPAEVTEPITWRFQSYCDAALTDKIFRPYLEQLERASGGRMKVEIYIADELVATSELIPALAAGTVDITCHPDEFMAAPIGGLSKISSCLPFNAEEGLEIDALWRELGLDEIWEAAYDDVPGVTYLSIGSWDTSNLITTKPIRKFEDMNGLKIHSMGAMEPTLALAGIAPVTLPWEDIQMAIQTGMIDGLCWCGATEGYTCGWIDVCDYFLTNVVGRWALDWVVSTDSWESLPPDLQELWRLTIDSAQYNKTVWYYWGEAHYRLAGEGGKSFILTTLPDEDWARMTDLKESIWDDIAAMGAREAQAIQILRDYQDLLEAAGTPYRCAVPD
ncbi:MAG: TRAP transporter substrate-binding protein DctP [Dehalococcoidales bacterium]|nr:TRAP transporter substrate-binding protein DctP [Dehalococcoidales bacterium]